MMNAELLPLRVSVAPLFGAERGLKPVPVVPLSGGDEVAPLFGAERGLKQR